LFTSLRGIAVRKNGVASLAYGDEAIQRARSAQTKTRHSQRALRIFVWRAFGARWIASLRSQ
jgi:hypothetical protein